MSDRPDPLINIEAEAALLGGMLIDNRIIVEWAPKLTALHFFEPLHQRIYSAMMRVVSKGNTASAITLKPVFSLDPHADGGAYLDQLVDNPAAVVGANDFAEQIIDFASRRTARDVLRRSADRIEQDMDASVGEVVGAVADVGWEDNAEAPKMVGVGDMIRNTIDRQRQHNEGEIQAGIGNKLVSDIDAVIGDLDDPQLIYLAARPGMGKTTLAVALAMGWSLGGAHGAYALLEGTKEQLEMRIASASTLAFHPRRPVPHSDIKKRKLDAGQVMVLSRCAERADMLPMAVIELGICNIKRVWAEAARHKAFLEAQGKKLRYLIVDYAGLCEADIDGKPIDDDRKRMNAVSRTLIKMKKALDCTIVALVQVSRGVESRANKRPVLSDLKETGNLEQDGDQVLFVYRHEEYLALDEPKRGEKIAGRDAWDEWDLEMKACQGKMEAISAKNRHDFKLTRTLRFLGEYYAVRNMSVIGDGQDEPVFDLD